jgi:hypothetical protein
MGKKYSRRNVLVNGIWLECKTSEEYRKVINIKKIEGEDK